MILFNLFVSWFLLAVVTEHSTFWTGFIVTSLSHTLSTGYVYPLSLSLSVYYYVCLCSCVCICVFWLIKICQVWGDVSGEARKLFIICNVKMLILKIMHLFFAVQLGFLGLFRPCFMLISFIITSKGKLLQTLH